MKATFDIAIVGGGPAGMATAIGSARRGLRTIVFERNALPQEKACGEGILPSGLKALSRLGIHDLPGHPIKGIRFVDTAGGSIRGSLHQPAMGVKRSVLSEALWAKAIASGAIVKTQVRVESHVADPDGVSLHTSDGNFRARILVGADGLQSSIRRSLGESRPSSEPLRFGMRKHFQIQPWTSDVEVHVSRDADAYVTPVASDEIGIAFLWRKDTHASSFEHFLARFPALFNRLSSAAPISELRGAGPFRQSAGVIHQGRVVLVGDAAGYVDAISGEGISLGILGAEILSRHLSAALINPQALAEYEREWSRLFKKYQWVAESLLYLSNRPFLRRGVLTALRSSPRFFERILNWAIDLPADRALDSENVLVLENAKERTIDGAPREGRSAHVGQ